MKESLAVARYRFRMVTVSEIVLPAYKGSAFHGGFGHALRRMAPSWYRLLFEPGPPRDGTRQRLQPSSTGNAWPKPFVLLPPLDEQRRYPKDHPFECELTLFGPAIQQFPVCHAALEYLGGTLGLGDNRGKFRVEGVDAIRAAPPDTTATSRAAPSATLRYVTRLRLKAGNRLQREAPPFPLFMARLLGRLNTLGGFYGDGVLIEKGRCCELLGRAEQVTIEHNGARWEEWSRYSGRQKEWMKFGGLLGSVTYAGDMTPFLPWLKLGEWVHVGGKSSFGLGKYEISTG